jgi:hypothetical protein
VQCDNCGREFDDNLDECPHCQGGKADSAGSPRDGFCRNCGLEYDEDLTECPHCHGANPADWPARMREKFADESPPKGPPPATHLVWAILVCLFCCMPFGIIAVVYAAMAQANIESKDYRAAARNADRAMPWILLGMLLSAIALFAILFFGQNFRSWLR